MHIRVNDVVEVIAGDDKGQRGTVLKVDRTKNKVTVQGINLVYKHVKPNQQNRQGGRLSKEMPVAASNVMLIDPSTNKATRVGTRTTSAGVRELYAKKTGTLIRVLRKAKEAKK